MIFEEKLSSIDEVIGVVVHEVVSWLLVLNEFKDFLKSLFLNDWVSSLQWAHPRKKKKVLSWITPLAGLVKLNFDGSSKGNLSQAGFRCVIRDHNSKIIRVTCRPLGFCNAIQVEVSKVSSISNLKEANNKSIKIKIIKLVSCVGTNHRSKTHMK